MCRAPSYGGTSTSTIGTGRMSCCLLRDGRSRNSARRDLATMPALDVVTPLLERLLGQCETPLTRPLFSDYCHRRRAKERSSACRAYCPAWEESVLRNR